MKSNVPNVLKREPDTGLGVTAEMADGTEVAGNTVVAAGDTTKRHRHTLSDLSSSVTTVIQEEVEEEEEEEEEEHDHEKASLDRQSTVLPGQVPGAYRKLGSRGAPRRTASPYLVSLGTILSSH